MKGGTLQLAKEPSFQAAHLPSTSTKYGTLLLWNLKRLPKQNTYDGREKPPTSILQFRMVGVVVFEERKVCMVWEGRQATQEGEKEGRRGGGCALRCVKQWWCSRECAREKPERGRDGCQRKCLGNDEVPETGGTTIEWAAHFDQLLPHKYSYAVRVMTGKEWRGVSWWGQCISCTLTPPINEVVNKSHLLTHYTSPHLWPHSITAGWAFHHRSDHAQIAP